LMLDHFVDLSSTWNLMFDHFVDLASTQNLMLMCGFQRVGIQNKFDPRRSICETFCLEIVLNWILASQKAKPVLFQGHNLQDFVSTVNLMEDWRWPNKCWFILHHFLGLCDASVLACVGYYT
jgi:hypothetical protein